MSDEQSMTVTTTRDDGTTTVTLAGELDLHSAGQLAAAVTAALDDDASTIDIDADRLTFADSAGLRALLVARNDATARQATLRVTRMSPALERLLDMTGLRDELAAP